MIKFVLSIAKEFFSLLATLILIGAYWLFGKEQTPAVKGKNPVLLIHGFFMNSAHFTYLRCYLEKNDIGPIYTVDLGSPFLSIEDYAKKVASKIETIRLNQHEKLTLIGHSMGGIVAARYLANCEDISHIAKLFTLGSPLQGTYLAYFFPSQCTKEMRPSSFYLEKLEKDLRSKSLPLITCGSELDLVVLPNRFAFFKTVNAEKKVYPNMGHNSYLFSKEVADYISSNIN